MIRPSLARVCGTEDLHNLNHYVLTVHLLRVERPHELPRLRRGYLHAPRAERSSATAGIQARARCQETEVLQQQSEMQSD